MIPIIHVDPTSIDVGSSGSLSRPH